MKSRTLVLKREALQQLTAGELDSVAGGTRTFSCLDYVSCFPWECLIDRLPETLVCVEA